MTKPPTSESSAAAGAVLPMTYDYWRDGICGAGPNAANIVAYNGEDVRPIARVENDLDREAIIRKHNNIVRRLSTPQPPPEAGSVGVPEGWQLVPKVATTEMVEAAARDYEGAMYLPNALWRSMLSAAPAPKETP